MADSRRDDPPGDPSGPERSGGATERGNFASWYQLAGVGFEFIAAVLMLGGMGWLLDRWLDSGPWLLIVGMCLGFVLGLYLLIKAGMKSFRD